MEKKILEEQWLKGVADRIPVLDEASISVVRERVRSVGRHANCPEKVIENVALIATELAQNQLLHARFGEIAVRDASYLGVPGIEIIAADLGKGIANPAASLRGEVSTSGSMGAGLSAVHRLADELDFDIRLGEGTCIWTRNFAKPPRPVRHELAIMGRPYPGEAISGDAGFFLHEEHGILAGVADGLGHGYPAHEASFEAVKCVRNQPVRALDSLLLHCNESLSELRGAAINLARIRDDLSEVSCFGVGDVRTHLYHLDKHKRFATTPHILGQHVRAKFHPPESAPILAGAVLVMFTDGLKSEADLNGRFDLMRQPSIVIAQTLLEEFGRSNDDALVFVAKFRRLR